jgi:hypothetical protein
VLDDMQKRAANNSALALALGPSFMGRAAVRSGREMRMAGSRAPAIISSSGEVRAGSD